MQCDMNLTSKNSQSTNQNSRNDVEKKLWYNYKNLYHWWFDIQILKDMRTLITTPQKKQIIIRIPGYPSWNRGCNLRCTGKNLAYADAR